MREKRVSNKGFTLVELLAVILIIGILLTGSIVAVMHFIDRAKDEQKSSQEKTISMAAESYLQENRSLLPKSIGETTTIPISTLRNSKYLTEDIKNSAGDSCMEKSYATAYKESKVKYVYKAYLYCGDDKVPEAVEKAIPTINIDFVDAEGNSIKNDSSILNKVGEAKFTIAFTGGEKDGEKIAIDGYSYSILVKVKGESVLKEVYSSGTLSANRATDISVNRDNNLKDYIDISTETTVAIKATVRNVDGGLNDKVEFVGAENSQAEVIYHDTTPPICVTDQTKGEASANDWININSSNKERKITVVCKDGSGSGCVRSTFTKTWSSGDSFEYDNIQIKDNAGNTTNCRVRVNIDSGYPVISLDAFAKGTGDNSVGSSVLTGTKTTKNSSNGTARINANEYSNLNNGYMNSTKYSNGIIYKVSLSDNISLKNWEWKVNKKGINSTTDANYENVDVTESEDRTGSCVDKKDCTFNVTFENDGLRKGVLTVYDKSGNKATYTIYANIDSKAPNALNIVNSSTGGSTGNWTKNNVTLTLSSSDAGSGIDNYYYTYDKNTTSYGSDDSKQWVSLVGGNKKTSFTTQPWISERNSVVYLKVCDIAGNCSSISDTKVMIDKTAPTGLVVTGYKKNNATDISSVSGLSTIASNTWYKGWVIVAPSNATDSGSGGIYYTVTTTGTTENVTNLKQNYRNVDAQGTSTVSFKACDKLDNCSAAVSFVAKLDRTASTTPTIVNSSGGNWTKNNITLNLASSDTLSGIGEYYYSYNNAATAFGTNDASQWVKLSGGTSKTSFTTSAWSAERNQKVYIKSCDKVENCSGISETWIRIDKTAPAVPTITNPSGGNWTKNNFSLTLKSSDSGSGLNYYQYTYSSSATATGSDNTSQWVTYASSSAQTFTTTAFSAERNQLVYLRACDMVGNCSAKSSTYIRIDKTGPTCTTSKSNTGTTSGVTVNVTCSDGGSGCSKSNPYTQTTGLKSSKTYTVSDNLGNTGSCSVSVTSYQNCPEVKKTTTYTAAYCTGTLGGRWVSCGNTSTCNVNGFCGGNSAEKGCCWTKSCTTYYK